MVHTSACIHKQPSNIPLLRFVSHSKYIRMWYQNLIYLILLESTIGFGLTQFVANHWKVCGLFRSTHICIYLNSNRFWAANSFPNLHSTAHHKSVYSNSHTVNMPKKGAPLIFHSEPINSKVYIHKYIVHIHSDWAITIIIIIINNLLVRLTHIFTFIV